MNEYLLDQAAWRRHPIAVRAPNVFFLSADLNRTTKDLAPDIAALDKRMMDLVMKVALARPNWLILVHQQGGSLSISPVIFFDGEWVGDISYEIFYPRHTSRTDVRFCLRSKRIRQQAQRKSEISTNDNRKALKTVLEKFIPTPLDDVLNASAFAATAKAKQVSYSALHYETDDALSPDRVYTFLSERGLWEDFSAYATTQGARDTLVEDVPKRLSAMKVSKDMEIALTAGYGRTLVLHGDTYYAYAVSSKWVIQTPHHLTYKVDELPEAYRGHIGMLKVASPNIAVPGIGVRVDSLTKPDVFIIAGKH